MAAFMVVCMDLDNEEWTGEYFSRVPALLADYGGQQISGGRSIEMLEGDGTPPDRVAIFTFPDCGQANRFMEDDRYRSFLEARRAASRSQIYLFENELRPGGLT